MNFGRKVRVVLTSATPIYRYVLREVEVNGKKMTKHVKTDEVLRVEEQKQVLFQGSEDALRIWERSHSLPVGAKVEKSPRDVFRGYYEPLMSVVAPRDSEVFDLTYKVVEAR